MWEVNENFLIFKNKNSPLIFTTIKPLINKIFKKRYNIKNKIPNFPYLKLKLLCGIIEFLNLNEEIILFCEQVHSNNVVFVDKKKLKETQFLKVGEKVYKYIYFSNTDGIITSLKNSIIFIFTADCIPLFLYEEKGDKIGLVHLGRKGLELGILDNTIEVLITNNAKIANFNFVFGPHICQNCYIVDGKIYNLFEKAKSRLLNFGIKNSQIYHSRYCTSCDNHLFYSYRKENKTDLRNISSITKISSF